MKNRVSLMVVFALQTDPAFLAHEGNCSIATKKLSNALVRVLTPAEEKQSSIRKFLEPYKRQPGGSPPMACYKETVLSRETRDRPDPYTLLELKKQILFFNTQGATCFAKAGNTNAGGADVGEPDIVVRGFSTYIFKFPRDHYIKITVAGDKGRTYDNIQKNILLLDTSLDKYTPLFGRPRNAFGGEYVITDSSPCDPKQIGEGYEARAKKNQLFIDEALRLIREFSLARIRNLNEFKPLIEEYETECGKNLYQASKNPYLQVPRMLYEKNISYLK